MPQRRPHAAFSLLELLVVVGIIALLIALVLPALSASRRRAKQTACLANLRSLAAMVEVYMQQGNPTFPDASAFPIASGIIEDITLHIDCLPYRLHPFMPNQPTRIAESWWCPVKGAEPPPLGLRALGHGTYPFNARDLRAVSPWKIKEPARTGMLRELVALDRIRPDDRESVVRYDIAHEKGQNILYVDGHAEYSADPDWLIWGSTDSPAFPPIRGEPASQPGE